MPLSKARDKARKKKERAKSRLDRRTSPPQALNAVQPNSLITLDDDTFDKFIAACPEVVRPKTWVDADGNRVYEE